MYAMDALKEAAKREGVPTTHIGRKLGYADSYIARTANRHSNPQTNTFARMLDIVGYKLVIVPSDNVPSDAIIID